MRLALQRVTRASVRVDGRELAAIGRGLLVLVGVVVGDGELDARRAAEKVSTLRLFSDAGGKMNLALADVDGEVLAVSQFTLAGSIDRGRRPSFDLAMPGAPARALFEEFVLRLREAALCPVRTGAFGAHMEVELVNDGPVTLLYDTRPGAT